MRNLIWAGTFLLLILVASTIAAAAMIGMPISGGVQLAIGCMALLLMGWGYTLMAALPTQARDR